MSNGMEKIIENKTDYMRNVDNFIVENELTVTITLSEYRQLVKNDAISQRQIDEANGDKYTRERQIEQLEEENKKLKSELYELQKYYDVLAEDHKELRNEVITAQFKHKEAALDSCDREEEPKDETDD